MIKKYTALCLIIIPNYILTTESIAPRRVPEIFFIDQNNTIKMQTIEEGMERLKRELSESVNTTIAKHEQEHKTQQNNMKLEHEANLTTHAQSFIVRLTENAIKLDKQLTESQEKSDQQLARIKESFDAQSEKIQQALNSSATYQLIELNLKHHNAELQKLASIRKGLIIATPISAVVCGAIAIAFSQTSSAISLTILHGLFFGLGYWLTDPSNTEETIKELEAIRAPLNSIIEDQVIEIEQQQENNQINKEADV